MQQKLIQSKFTVPSRNSMWEFDWKHAWMNNSCMEIWLRLYFSTAYKEFLSTSFIPPLTTRYVSNCRLAPELHANIEACLVSFICYQYSYQQFFLCKWLLLISDILKVSDNEMYSLDDLCNTRSGALGPALRFCNPLFRAIIFLWFQCLKSFSPDQSFLKAWLMWKVVIFVRYNL